MIALQASTVLCPSQRGGVNWYSSASLSSGARLGFSVMPTVRWPCTLEWPRTAQMLAPGLPTLPRSKARLHTMWTFCTPITCCVRPMP